MSSHLPVKPSRKIGTASGGKYKEGSTWIKLSHHSRKQREVGGRSQKTCCLHRLSKLSSILQGSWSPVVCIILTWRSFLSSRKPFQLHLLLGLSVLLTAMCVSPWVLLFVSWGYLAGSPPDQWFPVSGVLFSISLSLKQSTYLIVTLCAKEQLESLALGLGSLAPWVLGCVSWTPEII